MPLSPPQDYRKTRFTHRSGLAADKPAAADVLPGTLYFSTDTGAIERSNGSSWAAYGNINQVISDTQTGSVNNWAPGSGIVNNTAVEWNGASDAAVTGIAGGVSGRSVWIKNVSSSKVMTFAHNSGSSSAANRTQNFVTGGPTPVAPGGVAAFIHDGTDFKMIFHHQGAWITPTFSAGDFTGSGSMTWTVDSGDIQTDAYLIVGNSAMYSFSYSNTTVGGTPSTDLRRTIPAVLSGFPTASIYTFWSRNLDNGTANDGFFYIFADGGSFINIRRDKTSGNWAASTNNTYVQGFGEWQIN